MVARICRGPGERRSAPSFATKPQVPQAIIQSTAYKSQLGNFIVEHSCYRRKDCDSVDRPPTASANLCGKLATYFPVMTEGVNYAADAPTVLFAYGVHHGRSGRARPCKRSVGICHCQDDPDRAAAQSLRAVVTVLRRLVADPKLRVLNRKSGYDPTSRFQAIDLNRTKC